MSFLDGYVKGLQINAAEDIAEMRGRMQYELDEARAYIRDLSAKYDQLFECYKIIENDRDVCAADRDAAYDRIGDLRQMIGMSIEEAYDPVDEKREQLLAERRAAWEKNNS